VPVLAALEEVGDFALGGPGAAKSRHGFQQLLQAVALYCLSHALIELIGPLLLPEWVQPRR
jgi:hypothetical protein